MCPPFSDPDQRLYVRNATLADIPGIIALSRRVYEDTGMYDYTKGGVLFCYDAEFPELVRHLPKVPNMEIQYGQSCILTPCDFPFARCSGYRAQCRDRRLRGSSPGNADYRPEQRNREEPAGSPT